MSSTNFRFQKKGQNARQAMVISGLSTIYRNNTDTHFIQSNKRTAPRVYLLNVTLEEMNKLYPRIHQIIERGRLRPKGTETFFVSKKMEHMIISDTAIYEIRTHDSSRQQQSLHERIPVDGPITSIEIIDHNNHTVDLLVDESYYDLQEPSDNRHIISTNHIVTRTIKKIVKTHPKSMNAFVFIFNESESEILDFYMTTENGIVAGRTIQSDRLSRTCKEDLISFIDQFKLCS
jgi:hypothetical protein